MEKKYAQIRYDGNIVCLVGDESLGMPINSDCVYTVDISKHSQRESIVENMIYNPASNTFTNGELEYSGKIGEYGPFPTQEIIAAEASKSKTDNSKICLTFNEDKSVQTGTLVKFVSPCSCIGINKVEIHGTTYSLVDAVGNVVSEISGETGGVFAKDSIVVIALNAETTTAYIQNAAKAIEDNIRPVETGGTGADTIAKARQNMNYIGSNPIDHFGYDTPDAWAKLKSGYALINVKNALNDQPYQYGFLENIVSNGTTVVQKFISTSGGVWYRNGDTTNGWKTYDIWGKQWVKMLDENNFALDSYMTGMAYETFLSSDLMFLDISKTYSSSGNSELFSPCEGGGMQCRKKGKVFVLAQLEVTDLSANTTVYCCFKKGTTPYATSFVNCGSGTSVHLTNQKIFSVEQYDIIDLCASSSNGSGIVKEDNRTSLFVMYLE